MSATDSKTRRSTDSRQYDPLTRGELIQAFDAGRSGRARCPLCDPDGTKSPALSIFAGRGNEAHAYCHRGCDARDLYRHAREVLGMYADGPHAARIRPQVARTPPPPTVDAEAQDKARKRALWTRRFNASKPGPHPYLTLKGIPRGFAGSRVWHDPKTGAAVLLIPGPDGKPAGRIYSNGYKAYIPGKAPAPVRIEGTTAPDAPPVIVEGYATAWAVQDATGRPVVMAWDAGHLAAAAAQYPDAVIIADNDARDKPDADIARDVLNGRKGPTADARDATGAGHKKALETGRPVYMDPRPRFDAWDVLNADGPEAVRAMLDRQPVSDRRRWTWNDAPEDDPRTLLARQSVRDARSAARPLRDIREDLDRYFHPLDADAVFRTACRAWRDTRARHLEAVEMPRRYDPQPLESLAAVDVDAGGLTMLKAPLASGKTAVLIPRILEAARRRGETAVIVTPRVSLANDTARRLNIPLYSDTASEYAGDAAGAVVVCLPSVTSRRLAELIDRAAVVILDEAPALCAFMRSPVCNTRTASNKDVFDRLAAMLTRARAVFALSADWTPAAARFLAAHVSGSARALVMETKPNGKALNVYAAPSRPQAVNAAAADAIRDALAGRPVYFASETVDLAEAVANMAKGHGLEALAVTRENKGNKAQRAFLNDPETEARRYALVACSPVLNTGVSIEHRDGPHFRAVYGVYAGISLTPASFVQSLARVRYVQDLHVYTAPNGRADAMTADALKLAADELTGTDNDLAPFDRLAVELDAEREKYLVGAATGLQHVADAQGYAVHRQDLAPADKQGTEAQKAVADARRAEYLAADPLTADEYNALALLPHRTREQERRLAAQRIRQFFDVDELNELHVIEHDRGRAVLWNRAAWFGTAADPDRADAPLFDRRHVQALAGVFEQVRKQTGLDVDAPAVHKGNAPAIYAALMRYRLALAKTGLLPRRYGRAAIVWDRDREQYRAMIPEEPPPPSDLTRFVTGVFRRLALPLQTAQGRTGNRDSETGEGVTDTVKIALYGEIAVSVTPKPASNGAVKGTPRVRIYAPDPDYIEQVRTLIDGMARAADRARRRDAARAYVENDPDPLPDETDTARQSALELQQLQDLQPDPPPDETDTAAAVEPPQDLKPAPTVENVGITAHVDGGETASSGSAAAVDSWEWIFDDMEAARRERTGRPRGDPH